MDSNKFVRFLTEDGTFVFANYPPVTGTDNLIQFLDVFYSSIKSLKHEVKNCIISGDFVAAEGMVTYTRHSGTELTVKFCNIFTMQGNLVKNYNIYIDASKLYEE
jgi:ketosteroid isomerase-like protein